MQPREFDDLLRSKSDQFEFGYNPKNWDKLVKQMDKKAGSRKIFLWIPLAAIASGASIAASLAMIIGIPSLLKQQPTIRTAQVMAKHAPVAVLSGKSQSQPCDLPVIAVVKADITVPKPSIDIKNEITLSTSTMPLGPAPAVAEEKTTATDNDNIYSTFAQKTGKTKQNIYNGGYIYNDLNEDAQDIVRKHIKTMISIAGGYNYGSASNGYSIGATGKRMIGDKFYVEGDVAFVNSNANEKVQNPGSTVGTSPAVSSSKFLGLAKLTVLAKTTSDPPPPETAPTPVVPDYKQGNYNSYYAQVAPFVGYNVMKHVSVGLGADVQSLLMDNKTGATADGINFKGSPNFDFGLIGKTECSLTKKMRAGLYYRKGMNNVIAPGNQYIERSYVQVQLKYTIFKH